MKNINLEEMMIVREENKINERMKFVMTLFGIKQKDVIRINNEGTPEIEESILESDLECFKKNLKRSKNISTLEPYIKGIIKVAGDKCNEKESKFLKKCYQELSVNSIVQIEEYFNFREKVNEYLAEERKEQSEFYFPADKLCYLQGMENYEVEEMERFEVNQSIIEFKEKVKELEISPEKMEFIVRNWESLRELAITFSEVDFKVFMNYLMMSDTEKIKATINEKCRLKPLELIENSIEIHCFRTMDYSFCAMKNIQKKFEKIIDKTRVCDLEVMLPVIEEIENITLSNMNMIFIICCSGAKVNINESGLVLEF